MMVSLCEDECSWKGRSRAVYHAHMGIQQITPPLLGSSMSVMVGGEERNCPADTSAGVKPAPSHCPLFNPVSSRRLTTSTRSWGSSSLLGVRITQAVDNGISARTLSIFRRFLLPGNRIYIAHHNVGQSSTK